MELKINAGQTVRIIVDDAPDPDRFVFDSMSSPAPFRLATTGARKLGYQADAATNGALTGRGDVDVHVAITLDELAERGRNLADWLREEVIPRLGDHKLTLEVLR